MKLKEHLAINAITFFPLLFFAENYFEIILYFLLLIYAIMPDLDNYQNFSILKILPFLLSLFFFRKPKHRDIFHSLFSAIILSFLLNLPFLLFFTFRNYLILVFFCFLSYFLHLLLDSFTRSGVKLFLPFSEKKFSGSLSNKTTIIILILVILAQFLFYQILEKENIILANFLLLFLLKLLI